jgi:hypothetical protein
MEYHGVRKEYHGVIIKTLKKHLVTQCFQKKSLPDFWPGKLFYELKAMEKGVSF